ncbi:MAG: SpoIIE family protein phosphatase [Bacteroidales bacterium]|nr:SpoIIE family protein phosphatase [Bacteroidales bacterium]
MKKKFSLRNKFLRRELWTGMLLLVVAALTLEATTLVQYYFAQKSITEIASRRAEDNLENAKVDIMNILNQVETAIRNDIWMVRACLPNRDTIWKVTEHVVSENPAVVGSTVALVPGYYKDRKLFSPYSFRDTETGEIIHKTLAYEEYDYPSKQWFIEGLKHEDGFWSEPYLDVGGGDIMMTTFSMPVRDYEGTIAAVITADISLGWLKSVFDDLVIYPEAFSMLFSREGKLMVSPVESLVMHNTIHEVSKQFTDTAAMKVFTEAVMSGKSGNLKVHGEKSFSHVYFAPIERTGWSMSIVIPNDQIMGDIKKHNRMVLLFQLIGLMMLLLILLSAHRNQKKYKKLSENEERLEQELEIAKGIQMSMIPKTFPPFSERNDIDLAAMIVPAKEVGGDLYDFFIKDEHLYFCIGDVSGKGVPASLVMAMTKSLFRAVSSHEKSPRHIVNVMNESFTEMNEQNYFMTFFCGVLDLANGHLRYCNAGHDTPLILAESIKKLPVVSNLPLGVIQDYDYQEQDTNLIYDDALFLYTDGVTEAENVDHKMFGENRMGAILHTRRSPQDHLKAIYDSVEEFVGGAPQSDDLTMLFIHFTNEALKNPSQWRLVLHNDIGQIDRLTEFINMIAQKIELDPDLAQSINLALEEAVMNVISYAYPEGTEGEIKVDASARKNTIRFTISDTGQEFDPTAIPEVDTSLGLEDRQIGGLGIHLVRKIMDRVSYQRLEDKNILTLTKTIRENNGS